MRNVFSVCASITVTYVLFFGVLFGGIFAGLLGDTDSAQARIWKPTKVRQAVDYLQIQYTKPNNEIVIVQWLAPAMFEDIPENRAGRNLAKQFVLVLIATRAGDGFSPVRLYRPGRRCASNP